MFWGGVRASKGSVRESKRGVRRSVPFINYVERNELCILRLEDETDRNLYRVQFFSILCLLSWIFISPSQVPLRVCPLYPTTEGDDIIPPKEM